jgi:hypothetical protein
MLQDLLRAYYYLDANILRGFDAIMRLRWQIGTSVINIDVLSIIRDFRGFQQKQFLLFVILQVNYGNVEWRF